MSVFLSTVSEPDGNHEPDKVSTLGGRKPLHRFLICQPKIIGTAVLIIGASSLIVAIAITPDTYMILVWMVIPPEMFFTTLLIICGIVYIVTEHSPTKKTVTASLALSIVSILGGFWTIFVMMVNLHFYYDYTYDEEYSNDTDITNEIPWTSYVEVMTLTVELVYLLYSLVGTIILIIMSVFAGIALHSSKMQTTVVMMSTAAETPVK